MLTIEDHEGVLGTITLDGGKLTGSTGATQMMADDYTKKKGSAQAAFDAIKTLNNGYIWARAG